MKISFFNASELDKPIKCTIQRTGKLGFSEGAIRYMGITNENNRNILIGVDETAPEGSVLYAMLKNEESADAFKINKAGEYYYVNTKVLFDTMNYDYTNKYITFDISKVDFGGQEIYKLSKREKTRYNNEEIKEGGED